MPSMNLPVPSINGYFDSAVLPESQIYTMGGANMSIQVSKKYVTDTGSVSLLVTNQAEAPYDWKTIITVSIGDAPEIVPTQFGYFKMVYTGTGLLSCCYSD